MKCPYLDVIELEGALADVVVPVKRVVDLNASALHQHEL